MSRNRLKLASLLVAFAFQAAALSEALQLRECPHHDPVVASTSGVEHEPPHRGGAGDMHAAHGANAGDYDASDHDDHGGCTCVSVCDLGASTTALVAGSLVLALPDPADADFRLAGDRDFELPGPPDHLHPFALGPPLDALL